MNNLNHQAPETTPDVHMFLLHALLLRFQSGSNCRHNDLVAILWTDVAKHDYVVGLDECIFSVKITPSFKGCPKGIVPLEYYASDPITATLVGYWYNLHATSGKYFFPKVSAHGQLDFSAPMEYTSHKIGCQLCAEVLGLQVSDQFKAALGANAIRRGNAAKVGIAMKGASHDVWGIKNMLYP